MTNPAVSQGPAPSEPTEQACCAHTRVEWRTEDFIYDGPDVPNPDPTSPHVGLRHGSTMTRGWWECRDCKTHFVPKPAMEYEIRKALAGAGGGRDTAREPEFSSEEIRIAALRSAFISGLDHCRQHYQAYDEWPSLEGRVEIAQDEYPDPEPAAMRAATLTDSTQENP